MFRALYRSRPKNNRLSIRPIPFQFGVVGVSRLFPITHFHLDLNPNAIDCWSIA